MAIKDRVVTWFIQNVILPQREIIDKPGFVITTFTEKNQTTYLRDLFLPEHLFELIETKIVETFGREGKQVLYSAGKKFGYLYASMSNFPTIKDFTKKEFSEFAYLLVRYIEGTFAKQAKHEINFDQKSFTISFKDYVICRHNGLGYLMTAGGIGGIWAYAMQDKSLEGAQVECQGRGDNWCFVICAPPENIQNKAKELFKETNLPEQKFDETYKTMNQIRETKYSQNSLRQLLDAGFFEYKEGILSYKKIRFFHCESHVLYLLEQEISKLKNGEQVLFDACVEYGKFLMETYGETDYQKFVLDFFPALGFGDMTVMDIENGTMAVIYYPWTIYSNKSKYIIFRGIMSGIISSALGKTIKLKNFEIDTGEYLTLTIRA